MTLSNVILVSGKAYLSANARAGYAIKSVRDDHFRDHGGETPFEISERVSADFETLIAKRF